MNGTQLYVALEDALVIAWDDQRWRSDSAWRTVREGLPDPAGTTISSLASTSSTEAALYAASNRGVCWSVNGGLSWKRLDLDWPERFQRQRVSGLCATTTRL